VSLVAESGAICVAGNHDLMAIDRLDEDHAGALARTTLEWTRGVLGAEARAYLEGLPPRTSHDGVAIAHGSLDDPTAYVWPDRAGDELARLGAEDSLLVLGHTHSPMVFGEQRGALLDGRRGRVSSEEGERLLVNPGSVGQPREWRPLVRYAVLDLDAGTVELHARRYDHRSVRDALAERGLPPDACHRRQPVGRALRRLIRR
jgi:diadenosine tetraphosphatase ApaH/serine/threonine PP2A family protein phosphatase